jgi:hypothetical protein
MLKKQFLASLTTLLVLLLAGLTTAQVVGLRRESAKLVRLRPADVFLANHTILVKVIPVDSRAAGMTERMRLLITNRMIGINKNLREVSNDPYYMVDCSLTRYEYNESIETKRLLIVKEQGTFKVITASLEASYKVLRVSDNSTLSADNIPASYKREFRVGVETAPVQAEVEDALMNTVLNAILVHLTDTEEKLNVRLMGRGGLSRFARLAQAGQWAEYIESLKAIPEQKVDKNGKSSFEGDRHYNLSIAYEDRFYETMWKDYKRAEQYFDLADSEVRKARQYDPRETEYIAAQARLGQGKAYFNTIRERFPRDYEPQTVDAGPTGAEGPNAGPNHGGDTVKTSPPPTSGAITNRDVIGMVSAGVSERLVIEQINEATIKQFDTSPRGIIQLTTAGVSERVIDVIKKSMRTPTRQTPRSRKKRRPDSGSLPPV